MSENNIDRDLAILADSIAALRDLLAGYEPGNAMMLVDLVDSFKELAAMLYATESKACLKLAKELEVLVGMLPSNDALVVPLLAEITELVGQIASAYVGEDDAEKAAGELKKKRKALQNVKRRGSVPEGMQTTYSEGGETQQAAESEAPEIKKLLKTQRSWNLLPKLLLPPQRGKTMCASSTTRVTFPAS